MRNADYGYRMADVVIVGGGIGGLAAAHAVRQAGHEALVLERAPSVTAIGAGLVLWANAVRAIDSLGLGDGLRTIAATAGSTEIRSLEGGVLSRLGTDALVKRGRSDAAGRTAGASRAAGPRSRHPLRSGSGGGAADRGGNR